MLCQAGGDVHESLQSHIRRAAEVGRIERQKPSLQHDSRVGETLRLEVVRMSESEKVEYVSQNRTSLETP